MEMVVQSNGKCVQRSSSTENPLTKQPGDVSREMYSNNSSANRVASNGRTYHSFQSIVDVIQFHFKKHYIAWSVRSSLTIIFLVILITTLLVISKSSSNMSSSQPIGKSPPSSIAA